MLVKPINKTKEHLLYIFQTQIKPNILGMACIAFYMLERIEFPIWYYQGNRSVLLVTADQRAKDKGQRVYSPWKDQYISSSETIASSNQYSGRPLRRTIANILFRCPSCHHIVCI